MDRANPKVDGGAPVGAVLRTLPSIDALVRRPGLVAIPRALLLRESRQFLDGLRSEVLAGRLGSDRIERMFASGEADRELVQRCERARARNHRRVINGTGIVLHTGLGRAALAEDARQAVLDATGYAVVELDATSGLRNQREERVAELLCSLTGSEGALVVNNNAAMVNLVLRALAEDREVVVSRGELVEIGGGFRMPDVMEEAGCRMVEVGATNRTHLRDYQRVIGPDTAMLLKVHPSNFRIEGFAKDVGLAELVTLGREHEVLVFEDLGSGLICPEPVPHLVDEPHVADSLATGVPLCCFSGDKLLGGPQCGILLGDRELVARVHAHPLYRAFRCDKMSLAALEATLLIYQNGDPLRQIPCLRAISAAPEELAQRAERLVGALKDPAAEVVPSDSFVGSGANPARPIPSFAVALPGGAARADRLRDGDPGIFTRVADDRVLLDMRSLVAEDLDAVAALVADRS